VARSVPAKKQTATNSLLSMCRIMGMAIGPGLNILVAKVDIPITKNWGLDSLNSVGIVLVVANMISMVAIYYLLEEPNEDNGIVEKEVLIKDDTTPSISSSSTSEAFLSFLSMDILVPMLSIFTFNSTFQLIETAFAPAANDALGWGPIQSSFALGSISFVLAANMFVVIQLSKRGVSDENMLCGGLVASAVAYTVIYLSWIKDSTPYNFYLPIVLGSASYPYMAATTRSIFTSAVKTKPALKEYHGLMQAVLSMAASVAGFTTPGIVTAYCLRSPEEVLASSDLRELAPFSLIAPAMPLVVLLGMVYLRVTGVIGNAKNVESKASTATTDEILDRASLTESSTLLPESRSIQKRRSSNLKVMLEGNFDGLAGESIR